MPTKYMNLKQRIVDMDLQGVAVQSLSLTSAMVFWGTRIWTTSLPQHGNEPLFEPVWRRIEQLDLPIFLHPQQREPMGGDRLRHFYLSNFLGNPFDTTIAACHLIFGDVFDRHPRLEISLAHGGGALPILIGRVEPRLASTPGGKTPATRSSTRSRLWSL